MVRTRVIWSVSGILVGTCLGYLIAMSARPPLGCARGELRVLTRDVAVGQEYFFASKVPPIRGVLLQGSQFEVHGQLGGRVYVSFHTVLREELVKQISTRANGGSVP